MAGQKGRGALLLKQGEPRKIGPYQPQENSDEAKSLKNTDVSVSLFFNNLESIDAFIDALKIVRSIIEGRVEIVPKK